MLYIVSTPIGNLDDLSIRQAKTLISSDIILAEDTRSAQIIINAILERFHLQSANNNLPKIISYYKEREFEKLPEIIDLLEQEKNISLISQAGTPLISDPGFLLVKTAVKKNLPITVIPGPSAVITALTASGLEPKNFMYLGFLPKKINEKTKIINKLIEIKKIFPETIFVFYESPQRINETLRCIDLACRQAGTSKWNPEVVICREMTKKFEEIIREPINKLIEKTYKGEITVVIK